MGGEELACGSVAAARDLDPPSVEDDRLHRHLVPGQGPGLVGADDGNRAEGLDGGEAADQRPHPGHPLHADGEGHRRDGREPLGHRRDRQRDADFEHVEKVVAAEPAGQHDDGTEREHDPDEGPPEPVELLLERRLAGAGLFDHDADLADLRPHAGGGDEEPATPVGHGRAHEGHADPISEHGLGVGDRIRPLADSLGLAGQGRLLNLQPRGLDDAAVGG